MASPSSLEFVKAQLKHLPIATTRESCQGCVYIVTGSNSGIGREAVKHLVSLGSRRVIMAVRSPEKGEAERAAIEAETGVRGVAEVWELDMASYDSIRAFAGRCARELDRLDALVLNATAALDRWTTAEGMETTVTTNVFGTVLLLLLAMPQLRRSAAAHQGGPAATPPHVVVVTSTLAFGSPQLLGLCQDDVFVALNRDGPSAMSSRYAISKGVQMMVVRSLTARLLTPERTGGVVVNLLSPGLCNTGMARHMKAGYRLMVWAFNALIGRSPEMGSRTILHAMVAGKESHGKLVSDCEVKERWYPDWMTNDEGRRLQEKVAKQFEERLEAIEPGVFARAVAA